MTRWRRRWGKQSRAESPTTDLDRIMSLQQIREGTISLTSCCWWWRQCYQRIGILVFVSVDVEIQEGGGWRFKASTATAALDKEDRKSPTDFVQHQNSNHRILLLLQEIIIRNWCILLYSDHHHRRSVVVNIYFFVVIRSTEGRG